MGSTCLDHAALLPEPNMEVKGSQITGAGTRVSANAPRNRWGAGWVAVARVCLHEIYTVFWNGEERRKV